MKKPCFHPANKNVECDSLDCVPRDWEHCWYGKREYKSDQARTAKAREIREAVAACLGLKKSPWEPECYRICHQVEGVVYFENTQKSHITKAIKKCPED